MTHLYLSIKDEYDNCSYRDFYCLEELEISFTLPGDMEAR